MEVIVDSTRENSLFELEYSLECRSGKIIIQKDHSGDQHIWLINDREMLKWHGKTYCSHAAGINVKAPVTATPLNIHATVELLLQAIPLIKPFRSRHKQLLQLVATTGRPALDLLAQNPAMAYLIISKTRTLPSFDRYQHLLTRLLHKKRHQILKVLHYPDSKWMAQLLAKIPPHECREKLFTELAELHAAAEKEKGYPEKRKKTATLKMKILRHQIRCPSKLLFTLLNTEKYFQQVSTAFLVEIGAQQRIGNEKQILYELDEILRIVDEELLAITPPAQIHSVQHLSEIHDELIDQLHHINYDAASRQVSFAPPLHQGTEIDGENIQFSITPLLDGEALYQEGKAMNHCIFSYQPRISAAEGRLYAYHACLGREQASVLIAFPMNQPPNIVEARGPSNQAISKNMQKNLDEWLHNYSNKQDL